MKAVVIFSGGMDSTTVLYWTIQHYGKENTTALTFDYGSKHSFREIASSIGICKHLGIKQEVVRLPFIKELFKSNLLQGGEDIPEGHYEDENMKDTVVPFRNGIMLSIAIGYAESIGADEVLFGAHQGDHAIYPDCRPQFIKSIRETAYHGTYNHIKLNAPFWSNTKGEIAERGKELGIDYNMTWTCYKGGQEPCGKCGACVERKEAMQYAGIPED